jgi:hypothetical protein
MAGADYDYIELFGERWHRRRSRGCGKPLNILAIYDHNEGEPRRSVRFLIGSSSHPQGR